MNGETKNPPPLLFLPGKCETFPMKTERRHDLEANSLAIKLANWIELIKPYTNTLLGVAAALVAVTAISSMMNSRSAATEESAWAAYAQAKNSSDPELEIGCRNDGCVFISGFLPLLYILGSHAAAHVFSHRHLGWTTADVRCH